MRRRMEFLIRGSQVLQHTLLGLMLLGTSAGMLLSPIGLGILAVQAQTVPVAVSRGYTLLEQGWVDDAIAAFRQALQRYPDSLEARLGLAIAYQRAGQDENAWNTYRQVLAQDPTNRRALEAVGLLGGYRPEWQTGGIEALTTLLNLDPNNQNARAQRALLLGYQGRYSESLSDYQIALANNPSAETILGAAQIYTYSGNYSQGLALFQRYQATGETIPNTAVTAYATALQETGNPAEAVRVLESRLRQFNRLDATAIQIRAALAIAHQANQNPEAALATLEPLRDTEGATLPLARALSTIGRESGNAQLYEEAIALYRRVLQQTSNPSPGLVTEVADVLSESPTSQAEALRLYQQLAAQQPNNLSLRVKRSVLERQLGEISSAQLQQELQAVLQSSDGEIERGAIAQSLIRLDPPDPELLPIYQSLLQSNVDIPFLNFRVAQILIQQGNYAAAREALTAYGATSIGAQDLAAELLLADIERREGNLEASARRYESLIARNPEDQILTASLRGLAGIRLVQNRPEEALAFYDQLLARNPNDLQTQLGRASLAYQVEQISQSEAETVLERWLAARPTTDTPPELFSLVGALPPNPQREQLYETLLAVNPDDIGVNRRLVQVLALRDPERAQARVDQVLSRNPDDINSYFLQGELAQVLGNLDVASQAYREVLNRQPENTDALSALGGIRFQQQRYTEATMLYARVLSLKPNDWETRRILAELSVAQDRPMAALQQLRRLQQERLVAGNPDSDLDDRIEQIQLDLMRRRGFQPAWERY